MAINITAISVVHGVKISKLHGMKISVVHGVKIDCEGHSVSFRLNVHELSSNSKFGNQNIVNGLTQMINYTLSLLITFHN